MQFSLDVLVLLSVVSSVLSMSPLARSLLQRVSRRQRRATGTSKPLCKLFGCVNGDCTFKNDMFNCVCHKGYKGKLCNEIDIVKDTEVGKPNRCKQFKNFHCNNGGSCVVAPSMHGGLTVRCECPPQWTGDFCDTPCRMDCKNGGQCHSDRITGEEMCLCMWGYSGRYCQIEKQQGPTIAIV
ncbi:sushi, nidogen and EGF-like domain-containing protein 1 [Saccostrea echinata]|uniref:sushi, nidogen and EGF-like domain-containing protein 1 n=1 Tax=Saccostrea echinata TaxID=191078 RepID=UPI002A8218A0|nr:sushi, nidogen and EGF-like domain-containing protein 1 [Saccostrea echinata]